MYIIAHCMTVDLVPHLGRTYLRNNWEDAVGVAVTLALRQAPSDNDTEIRKQLEADGCYGPKGGKWTVCIGIAQQGCP